MSEINDEDDNINVDVVRSVANYAVTYGRNNSPLGRNAMFCMDRYNCTLYDILYSTKIEDVIQFFLYLAMFLRFM